MNSRFVAVAAAVGLAAAAVPGRAQQDDKINALPLGVAPDFRQPLTAEPIALSHPDITSTFAARAKTKSRTTHIAVGAALGATAFTVILLASFANSDSEFLGNPFVFVLPGIGAAVIGGAIGWVVYELRSR